MIVIHELQDFSLEHSVAPGQAFRWTERDGWFHGVVGDRLLRTRQTGNSLWVESNREEDLEPFARDYFDLDRDYAEILSRINTDPPMAEAIEACRGLRVLRQPPWENLASYILSIQNNIPRIQGMIRTLARSYGRPLELGDFQDFSFPTAAELSHSCEADLRGLKMGFRSRSLCEAAQRVVEEGTHLEDLRAASHAEVRQALMQFRGVGEKVADCVALFSLDKFEAFPVDVWIKRTVERLYFAGRELPIKEIHAFAAHRWGPHAGYAQTYLFYHARQAPADRQTKQAPTCHPPAQTPTP